MSQIAARSGTTVKALQAANRTTVTDPNLIYAGAKLNVPDAAAGAAALRRVGAAATSPGLDDAAVRAAITRSPAARAAAAQAAFEAAVVAKETAGTAAAAAKTARAAAVKADLAATAAKAAASSPGAAAVDAAAVAAAAARAADDRATAARVAAARAAFGTPITRAITIQPGDTLSEIALREGTSVKALVAANAATVTDPNLIFAGARLNIPIETAHAVA